MPSGMKRKRSTDTGTTATASSTAPSTAPSEPVLPVVAKAAEIRSALAANDVLILIGDTGSGKTTQLPQLIIDADRSASVVVTQPRRVAAITVATRVAEERKVQLGNEVGYAVRFSDKSKRGVTRIRYVTDGVLLREVLGGGGGGMKKRYSHVVIDEVHERSVSTDLVLGVIKETLVGGDGGGVKGGKKDAGGAFAAKNEMFSKMIRSALAFKVVVMSATTDADKIVSFFRNKSALKVALLRIPGRVHSVKVYNAVQPLSDVIDGAVMSTMQIHAVNDFPGDILVFLPGQEEIATAIAILRHRLENNPSKSAKQLLILPLFAALSPEDQVRAVQPVPDDLKHTTRKVIFSTNIAETSITIPGIMYVVDAGLVKVRSMITENGIYADVLRVESISNAQAEQRKGRAGRTQAGRLYRLYTEAQYNLLRKYPVPEILRADAAATLLQIIALRHSAGKSVEKGPDSAKEEAQKSFLTFPLLDKVPKKMTERGLETLCVLGAVDLKMELTETGRLMARIPVPPMLARTLLESLRLGCVDAIVSLAAVLSVEGVILLSPTAKRDQAKAAHRRFVSPSGDQLTLMNALNAYLQVGSDRRYEFCRDHFLNKRTLASAESIRTQLDTLMQHGDMMSWALNNPLSAAVLADVEDAPMDELVRRSLVAGFFRHTARKRSEDDGRYVPIGGGGVLLERGVDFHPGSVLRGRRSSKARIVVYDELVFTSKPFLRTVVVVEEAWLIQHCGNYFRKGGAGSFDP